jgi:putative phage-type endonuclease
MISLEQNTDAWLDFRKGKIGASDIPIILGISPYSTPYELWRKKMGFADDEKETSSQRRGKALEPEILDSINKEGFYDFMPEVKQHAFFDWAIASLDGYDEKSRVVLEIKCTSKKNHQMVKLGNCPDIYYPQIQWQLFVADSQFCVLAHYFDGEIVKATIRRDDVYIESKLFPAAMEFYRCMTDFIAPEMLEKDYVQITDPDFESLASEWKEIKEQKEMIEAREKMLRKQILDYSDDGNCRGYGLVLRKKKRQGSVAWEQLWKEVCEKYGCDDFNPENYRKSESVFWEIKEEK